MPKKDKLHEAVLRALRKAGWSLVKDQLSIKFNDRTLYIDLVVEKGGQQIVVEVKGDSLIEMSDLERALGQFVVYRHLLSRDQPGVPLFLAVPEDAYEFSFGASRTDGLALQTALDLNFLVFDSQKEEIIRWIQ